MIPFPRPLLRAQMTELEHQCLVADEGIKQLSHAKHRKIEEEEIAQCRSWLKRAENSVQRKLTYYRTFDEAWCALQEIRHKFCVLLPLEELQRVVADIARDVDYLPPAEKKGFQDSIKAVDERLRSLLKRPQKQNADEHRKQEHDLRIELLRLSVISAVDRQKHWLRVNVLRDRLATTSQIVFVFLVAGIGVLIAFFDRWGIPADTRRTILGVLLFGAIGGFLSGLLRRELLTGKSSVFYIEHMLMGLRPIIGAITALIIYLAQSSGILNLFSSQSQSAFFFVAFLTGFSQQFFLRHVTSALQRTKKTGKAKATEDCGD